MERLVFLVVFFFHSQIMLAQTRTVDNYHLGKNISEYKFFDYNNNEISLDSFSGRYIYVDFWFSSCKPCISEVPFARKLEEIMKKENIVFVNISVEGSGEKWKKSIATFDISGINIWTGPINRFSTLDGYNKYLKNLNVKVFPRYWIVDPTGKIIVSDAERPSKYLKNNQLKRIINEDKKKLNE